MSKPTTYNTNIGSILAIIIASPILIAISVVFGIFTLAKFFNVITNPIFVVANLGLITLLYYIDKLNAQTIIYSGFLIGVAGWIYGVGMAFQQLSPICSIPILGGFLCGAGTLISVIVDLPGWILSGVVLSALFGFGLLMILKKR